jgi:hypothetical protein
MKRPILVLAALALLLCGVGQARAEYVVTISQSGNDVVASGTGSLNVTALTNGGKSGDGHELSPTNGFVELGDVAIKVQQLYFKVSGPTSFGPGGDAYPTSGTGDNVTITRGVTLGVPDGYQSGTSLKSSDTYANTTISGLGLTPGTYTWTWGSASAGTADDFKLVITSPTPAPEPASLTLAAVGAVGLAGYGWRKRKRAAV